MKRSVIQEVEDEFGEPFTDVVRGLADDGESIHAIAYILGYSSPSAFRRIAKKMDIKFVKGSQSNGTKASKASIGSTPARIDAARKASAANPNYIRLTIDGIYDTLSSHCRRIGIPVSTVRNRLRKGMSNQEAFKITSYRVKPTNNTGHAWRKQVNAHMAMKLSNGDSAT